MAKNPRRKPAAADTPDKPKAATGDNDDDGITTSSADPTTGDPRFDSLEKKVEQLCIKVGI